MPSQLAYIAVHVVPATRDLLVFAALSGVFSVFGRIVRGVTAGGGIAGAIVCFVLLCAAGIGGFAALLTVFLLTWACTRFGYAHKQRLGTAEAKTGRDMRQVLANLGIAAACAAAFLLSRAPRWLVAMGAALAEAAADTVSSEIGQAVGGQPRLITNWKRVTVGTNGALTLAGSAAGVIAAMVVALVCYVAGVFGPREALICGGAGIAGMIADSGLGATIENRQLVGNNAVNFISTMIAAVIALAIAIAIS